ncbi:PKD domain-containing protein [Blastococcus sp. TF02A_35]|uniref:PKD domain-containing protein n=1 Tax=Blastococcus sp. TF02A-35 TaxID=2559612 RepID=UPI0010736197|nr:PKD domain-containing protein [Blastococcus sp. TF02A_35]TFV53000.1 PKD domain-containing protein [Blastococcus sp. TF02A_35]
MSARVELSPRRLLAGLLGLLLFAGVLGGLAPTAARADSAPLDPRNPATPTTVTADPLPTVQINGVAWSQVVVGNTVYVAGSFSTARPAGAAPGTQETVRNNLLAYDIRTGALVRSFAPDLNGQARVVAASPDGSRIYVGGDFTRADGQARSRVAAYSTATGALVPEFRPAVTGQVRAIAATNSTVYLGGSLTAVGSVSRSRLAAVSAANGALLPWAPVPGVGPTTGNRDGNKNTSTDVFALVVTGGGSQVVASGRFHTLNGVRSTGVGALDPVSGATRTFAVNQLITNQGVNSAIYSLSTDGTTVYGTGYDYFGPGNLEGTFAADANGGRVQWFNDCRGDTYSAFATGGVVYQATHAHNCSNIGSFKEYDPQIFKYGTAVSRTAVGMVGEVTLRNSTETNVRKQPAPAVLPWFPSFTAGTVTKQYQAGWSVTGNDSYVVYAGEFPKVNGTAQEGLVRFASPTIAPNKVGPTFDRAAATATVLGAGTVRVAWLAAHDMDNENLTYRVYRDGDTSAPVATLTRPSEWWNRAMLGWTDRKVAAGTHTYRVTVSDPAGNEASTAWTSVDVATGGGTTRPYTELVRADGAITHWTLGERSGSTAYDQAGGMDLPLNAGVTAGVGGAIAGDSDTAVSFNGRTDGFLATQTPIGAPQEFSAEMWFQTSTRTGGRMFGFGNSNSSTLSTHHDRIVYMDVNGRLTFGVWPSENRTITTSRAYNDGRWHHVVVSLSKSGQSLYVDGALVGTRTDTTQAQHNSYGYWRLGGDTSWSGGTHMAGRMDEVALYPKALSASQVASHYRLGTTGSTGNLPPTAAFTSATSGLTVAFDGATSRDADGTVRTYAWNFGDGSTGTGVKASRTYAAPGTYPVTLTVTDDRGATAQTTASVTVSATPNVAPTAAFGSSGTGLAVDFDGSTSSDSDGSVVSWAWEFGDGRTGTGRTASHTYAKAGSYAVTLTVTDDDGVPSTVTQTIAVSDSTAPPAIASDAFGRTVTDGLGTADVGGAWKMAGPAAVADGVGRLRLTPGSSTSAYLTAVSSTDVAVQAAFSTEAMPTGGGAYGYLAARRMTAADYRASVKVTSTGKVVLGLSRLVAGQETKLTAVELAGVTYKAGGSLLVRLDAAGTGTTVLNAKAWLQGTPEPADWQTTASDSTAALQGPGGVGVAAFLSGSATAPLDVRVDDLWAGASGSGPNGAEPANLAPTAAFQPVTSGLSVSVDGSASADQDGSVAGYAWDFGDGRTATGRTASHTYAAAGTYQVCLTVTDDDGATGTVTRAVTVSAPAPQPDPGTEAPPLAADAFGRAVAEGLGTADVGGAWTMAGPASVADGVGRLRLAVGASTSAYLTGVQAGDVAVQTAFSLDAMPTGGGAYGYLAARRVTAADYRASVKVTSTGKVVLGLSRLEAGKETKLTAVELAGVTYRPGASLLVRLEATGSGTTVLNAKAWLQGTPEPAAWQTTASDSTAALQGPGGVGVAAFLSGSATAPMEMRVDDLWAGPAGTAPKAPPAG